MTLLFISLKFEYNGSKQINTLFSSIVHDMADILC